jgi:type IV secretion system protein VirD4
MSILFSCDFHASIAGELTVITKSNLIKKYGKEKYSGINYHIILGDGGFMWHKNWKTDQFNYKALACRPFPILCVIGNHEPILGMSDLPETDIGIGETVYQIQDIPFVAYLKRGKVYMIDGFKMLVLGGALSIDKDSRVKDLSWWELEYWTEKEKQDLFHLLKTEKKFDIVLSHTGPDRINKRAFESIMRETSHKFIDEVALLNNEIESKITFYEWWCGHFHRDKYFYDARTQSGYQYLYKSTKILDKVNNDKEFLGGVFMDNTFKRSSYARWASEEEIKSSLFKVCLNDDKPCVGGIPLFSASDTVYVEDKDVHSLIIGSTGSKKTRLIGMPALRMYANAGESFISTDPKAELYERTLPLLKKQGYKIFVLNLRNPLKSNGWNPLLIPYRLYHDDKKDKANELVIDMANCIIKNDSTSESFWPNSAVNLLSGLILTLFECPHENEIHFKSLRALRVQALKMTEDNGQPYIRDNFLKYISKGSFLHSLLSGTVEVCDETRSCIISEFDQAMRPFFCQDNLIDLLSGNDLDMSEIGKTKTAVFLIIPDENTIYHSLISVFVKQCYTELLREAEKHPYNKLPNRVNFLLDEFSSLPAISDFPAMITASRSRNIRFNLIIQSHNQLKERYIYHAETIKGNCENWVFLHSREFELLKEMVELAGKKNSDEPLVSASILQTLDKDKGEAFILHKRLYLYIANLLDIDKYPKTLPEDEEIQYPENTYKASSIFDFESFCDETFPEKFLVNEEMVRPIFTSYFTADDDDE